jgi:phenylalanyl-tRNA synthetase beta chain
MAAEVRNVKIAPSPRFITERLRAAGVRSINNLVDITNFVMLEYGHPMHAFDKRYVEGDKITVRDANYGEVITLLDGTTQTLDPETLVIADNEKAIAIAGVMGGEFSGIMEDTKEVVFESACFDGASVRKSAKKIGRRTESSARFEKGLNPVNAEIALFRALELVEQLGCGDVVKKVIDVKNFDESRSVIRHNFVKISDIIGQEIAYKEQTEIFKRLGFEQGNNENGAFLVIPPWRVDISLDCDLAEEVARIYGYNNIRSESILLGTKGFVGKKEAFTEKLRRYAVACGCYECLSFSFSSPNVYEKSGLFGIGGTGTVHIRNPLGDETASMRASMLPSMLDIVARNCKNTKTGRFFEIGRIYVPKSDSRLPEEKSVICIGAYGDNEDFFTIKGLTEEILNGFNVDADFVADRENASYHSGRCAVIKSGSTVLGTAGEIHPAVRGNFDIRPRAYAAEIDADVLFGLTEGYVPKFAPLPKYPAATRDLSLLCGESVTCSEVIGKIKSASRHLESVNLFDVYKGANIPDGKRSLSFGLVFRKNDGTFTDEEIDGFIAKILRGLEKDGITLRS